MLKRHILQFPPVRETADCVSSGRIREVKIIENFKQSSPKVVAYEWWSLARTSERFCTDPEMIPDRLTINSTSSSGSSSSLFKLG